MAEDQNFFILQNVINELMDPAISLTAPLLKLKYFALTGKLQPLLQFVTRELEGYHSVDSESIPEYRKTMGVLKLDLQALGHRETKESSLSLLENKQMEDAFRYIAFRESIAEIEKMIAERRDGDSQIVFQFPPELYHLFENAIRSRNPGRPIRVEGVRQVASGAKFGQVPTIVRSRLLDFCVELQETFGYKIEFTSLRKEIEKNNQTIYHIMNHTQITNTGDANVVNTGNNSTVTATITINKGDWSSLKKTLETHGIDPDDINELQSIVREEVPQEKTLGDKAVNWIGNVSKLV
jgi:hypothetical protein